MYSVEMAQRNPYVVLKTTSQGEFLVDGRSRSLPLDDALDQWHFTDGDDGVNYKLVTMAGPDSTGEFKVVLLRLDDE